MSFLIFLSYLSFYSLPAALSSRNRRHTSRPHLHFVFLPFSPTLTTSSPFSTAIANTPLCHSYNRTPQSPFFSSLPISPQPLAATFFVVATTFVAKVHTQSSATPSISKSKFSIYFFHFVFFNSTNSKTMVIGTRSTLI